MRPIWIASYPRSGNTLLRTILYQCFGLCSASVYPGDLGRNKSLEDYVGHIEHDPDGEIRFPPGVPHLIKTHKLPMDDRPAIYVVRDGRAACVSLWEFYGRKYPLEIIISGRNPFGSWARHLAAWRPWERPDTTLVRYEDMVGDLPTVLATLARFLDRDVLRSTIPDRDSIAGVAGKWVRRKSDWREAMTDEQRRLFDETNGWMMARMGYGRAGADT